MDMLILILLVGLAVFVVVKMLLKNGSKEKTAHVRILGKESRTHQMQGRDDDSLPTEFVVRFQAEGRELELLVSRSMFETAREGDEGTLTYKGKVFVDYDSDNQRPW